MENERQSLLTPDAQGTSTYGVPAYGVAPTAPMAPPEAIPTAPPADPSLQQYQTPQFMAPPMPTNYIAPPPFDPTADLPPPKIEKFVYDQNPFTAQEALRKVEEHVRKHFFLERNAKLRDLRFDCFNAFDILLESFTESRRTDPAERPYWGGSTDGPSNGVPPQPWTVPMTPPELFRPEKRRTPLPHTEEVLQCHRCDGNGKVTCSECFGVGKVSCSSCGGSGFIRETIEIDETDSYGDNVTRTEYITKPCHNCHCGLVTCPQCGGSGEVTCPTCDGARNLVHYTQLTVDWENQKHEKVVREQPPVAVTKDHNTIDKELTKKITGAEGPLLLREQAHRIFPNNSFASGVFRISQPIDESVNHHLQTLDLPKTALLLQQRLSVKGVPIYATTYRRGRETRVFYIYGTDHKVYAPNYPLSWWRVSVPIVITLLIIGVIVFFVAFRKSVGL